MLFAIFWLSSADLLCWETSSVGLVLGDFGSSRLNSPLTKSVRYPAVKPTLSKTDMIEALETLGLAHR